LLLLEDRQVNSLAHRQSIERQLSKICAKALINQTFTLRDYF